MNCSSLGVGMKDGMKQIAEDKRRSDGQKSLADARVTFHRIAV
jgi:hypothetical protein